MGRLNSAMGSYTSAIKSYEESKRLMPLDNSINDSGRDSLLFNVLIHESVAYFMNNDERYIDILVRAAEMNPVQTLVFLSTNPQLSDMKTKLIETNPLLASLSL